MNVPTFDEGFYTSTLKPDAFAGNDPMSFGYLTHGQGISSLPPPLNWQLGMQIYDPFWLSYPYSNPKDLLIAANDLKSSMQIQISDNTVP